MKYIYGIALFLAGVLALNTSCGSSSGGSDGVSLVDTLRADTISIDQIIQPNKWSIVDDKMVVYSPKNEKIFHFYSLPDFQYLGAHFTKGAGPGEFGFCEILKSNKYGDKLWLFDGGSYKVRRYGFRGGEPILEQEISTDTQQPFSANIINGRYVSYQETGREGNMISYVKIRDLQDKMNVTDSVFSYSVSKKAPQYGNAFMTTNLPLRSFSGDKTVFHYSRLNHTQIYTIDKEGKFSLDKCIGDSVDYEKVKTMDFMSGVVSKTVVDIYSSPEHIFLVCSIWKVAGEYKDGPETTHIEIYDWDMNLAKTLVLPAKGFLTVNIDTKNNKIYAYPRNDDFEQVYIYSYNI